jgi:hypothetical protein
MHLTKNRFVAQPELLVNRGDGSLDVVGPHDARDTDGRRRQDLDVDVGLGERLEHVGRDPGVRLHAGSDERHLPDVRVGLDALRADLRAYRPQNGLGASKVVLRKREEDVGVTLLVRRVLHDHVDVDTLVGEGAEHARGDTRLVGYSQDRHLRFGGVVCDPGDDRLFHSLVLLPHPGPVFVGEGRTHVDEHSVVASVFDAAKH